MPERLPARRRTRLPDYDYSQPGVYFVTVATQSRLPFFGNIRDQQMQLNPEGEAAQTAWLALPARFAVVEVDEFIVMPDHVHGIMLLSGAADAMNRAPTIGEVVRTFKAASTRLLRTAGLLQFAWQRNYYEHIVRSERELDRIRRYIRENPMAYGLKHEEPALVLDPPRQAANLGPGGRDESRRYEGTMTSRLGSQDSSSRLPSQGRRTTVAFRGRE